MNHGKSLYASNLTPPNSLNEQSRETLIFLLKQLIRLMAHLDLRKTKKPSWEKEEYLFLVG